MGKADMEHQKQSIVHMPLLPVAHSTLQTNGNKQRLANGIRKASNINQHEHEAAHSHQQQPANTTSMHKQQQQPTTSIRQHQQLIPTKPTTNKQPTVRNNSQQPTTPSPTCSMHLPMTVQTNNNQQLPAINKSAHNKQ